ncbi:MAG: DUF898 family protein [Saprospiraceae bacterium]|nr:DUF898 family protein [Saprospiraceae bacterium]
MDTNETNNFKYDYNADENRNKSSDNFASKFFKFHGEGKNLFILYLVNTFATIFTLGLYYPWARASFLKFFYQETSFDGSRFTFLGTGREMFRGFLKALGLGIMVYGGIFFLNYLRFPLLSLIFIVIAGYLILPAAIHGALRYRLAKTTWRGIHFSYSGDLNELRSILLKNTILVFISFGFYLSWARVDVRKYIMSHTHLGNLTFGFDGEGDDLFFINLKGVLLSIVTLYIYIFWYLRNLFNFYVNNTYIVQDEKRSSRFVSTLKIGSIVELVLINFVIVIFTLGLGTPWAICRTYTTIMQNMELEGDIDFDIIKQKIDNFDDASGDDMVDILDIGIV